MFVKCKRDDNLQFGIKNLINDKSQIIEINISQE